MSNQEESFPQSAQEADEQQNPSFSQENLPNLDEEQLGAVTGAGWRNVMDKIISCVSCQMTPPSTPRAAGPHPQMQQLGNFIDQHRTPQQILNSLPRSGSGSSNEGSVGLPPPTPRPGTPGLKHD